jgi:hypothetical protein
MTGRELWRATILLSALTCLFAFPLTIHPFTHGLRGGPDHSLYLWTLAWNAHAFVAQPFALFDANIYHPLPNTLAYSENLIGVSLMAAPIQWITGHLTFSLNAVSLIMVVLCGLGAYVLARQIGLGPAAAFVAAMIFAFAPSRFFRIGQTHLGIHWLPFCLAFLHKYLDQGRARDLRIAIGFFMLQALTSGHGAIFLLVSVLGLLVFRAVTGTPLAPIKRLRDCGVTGALLLVPVVLVQIPYWVAQRDAGLRRTLVGWGVEPVSFLASPAHVWSMVLASIPATRHVNDTANAFLFPGVVPLVLAAASLRAMRRAEPPIRQAAIFYGLIVLLAYWLAVGPPVGLWQFVYWLPGLNFIREVSRFTMLGMLGLALLSAVSFEMWRRRLAPRRQRWLAVAVVVLLIGEFAAFPLDLMDTPVRIAPVDRWLDHQPKPFAIAEVPVPRGRGASERRQTAYMLHATAHWQKTVHGYSGIRQLFHEELYETLRGFPDDASLASLQAAGVTYVVVHTELYEEDAWAPVEDRLLEFRDRLTLVYLHAPGRVYRLNPP